MRNDLEQRFQIETKALTTFREAIRKDIVRWMFATVEFLSHELETLQTGAVFYAGGYDAGDRLLVVRYFKSDLTALTENAQDTWHAVESLPAEMLVAEDFISHRDDVVDISRFLRGELKEVYHFRVRNGRMLERQALTDRGFHHSRYDYEGRRMVRWQSLDDSGHPTMEINYGPHGEDTYYRVRRDGTKFQMGQGFPKGVTAKGLKETIRARLLALVPEVVANAKIAEPIYCVVLAYAGEGNDALPPMIGIGLESERHGWIADHGRKAKEWIWNPAEFYHYEKTHTQFEDDALEEACSLLNDHLTDRDSVAPAIKLLIEVAAELNQTDWPATIQRTDDFVVYAVDLELASLRKNLKACLSQQQLDRFKTKKLI